jgi:predicted PurR-regulated permease PerM
MSKSQTVAIVLAAIGFVYLAKQVGLPIVLACVAGMAWKPHWTWLWTISGALLSVPIVVSIKVVCDRVTAMSSVSELLWQNTSKG